MSSDNNLAKSLRKGGEGGEGDGTQVEITGTNLPCQLAVYDVADQGQYQQSARRCKLREQIISACLFEC